jgi:hypothetical protein
LTFSYSVSLAFDKLVIKAVVKGNITNMPITANKLNDNPLNFGLFVPATFSTPLLI